MSIVDEGGYTISTDDLESILLETDILSNDKLLKKSFLKYLQILKYFLRHPHSIPYDYCKDSKYKTDALKRKAYGNISTLAENGLLKISKVRLKRKSQNAKLNPYVLSLSGILYLIFNTKGMADSISLIRDLQKYYEMNLLFKLFLYPIISEKTIVEIQYDISFYSIIIEYLSKIGKDLLAIIKWLNKIKNTNAVSSDGFLMTQVFVWPKSDRKESKDIEIKLRFFLESVLKWDNTDLLRIEVKKDENFVDIIDSKNSLNNAKLTLLERESKAVLRHQGNVLHEFHIISNQDFLYVQTRSDKKAIDEIKDVFMDKHNEHMITFLTQLRFQLLQSGQLFSNPTCEVLSKDERYKKALDYHLNPFN
jgi:hypothetical protein